MSDHIQDTGTLAERINHLFDTHRGDGGKPLSNAAAAASITARTGVPISGTYLWQLRSGAKTNPTIAHLTAIADFFGTTVESLVAPAPTRVRRGVGADVTHLLEGSGPLLHVTALVRIQDEKSNGDYGETLPVGNIDEEGSTPQVAVARNAAAMAAETASAAVASWIQASERAVELSAGDSTVDDFLPAAREVGVAPDNVTEMRRVLGLLAESIAVIPNSGKTESPPK